MSRDDANVHMVVSGIVQGVGFRFFTQRLAHQYGLVGYVRNLPDGRVEIEAEGAKGLLQDFLREIRRGPRFGHVEGMEIAWREPGRGYSRFLIRHQVGV